MADIEAMDGVAAADIEAVDGVAKADIQAIDGLTIPAGGATLWTIIGADGSVATAAASNLNSWTGYDAAGLAQQDHITLAYGKDGSGDPLWVCGTQDGSRELRYSADPTDGQDWTDISQASLSDVWGVAWGNNVWISVGENGVVHRSTDGASWTELDLSGVTGWENDVKIWEVVSNGSGTWMFTQGSNVFHSTNDGSTWALLIDLADAGGLNIGSGFTATSMAYTASRWSVFLYRNSAAATLVCHAAASDTSAWAICTVGGSTAVNQNLVGKGARKMAAGDGTVIIQYAHVTSRSTNGGQEWTSYSGSVGGGTGLLPRVDSRDVATDGQGNWVIVHDNTRISISSDDGLTWAEQSGSRPTFDGSYEDLEAVASNVLLPV